MFKFLQERRNQRTVLAAVSIIMWESLIELYNNEEITGLQLAAWCSSPRRD